MIPDLLHNPTVGLIPTMPFIEEGHAIDPLVSVPMAIAQRLAETAAPDPELEPQGFRSSTNGFLVCPPLLLQPLLDRDERKLAHSLRFVFPSNTAPEALN
jgi:hypothetical protein